MLLLLQLKQKCWWSKEHLVGDLGKSGHQACHTYCGLECSVSSMYCLYAEGHPLEAQFHSKIRNTLNFCFFLGVKHSPHPCSSIFITSDLGMKHSWCAFKSQKVSGGLGLAPPAASGTVSLKAQKYLAESLQWAGFFLRLKEELLLPNSASKPLMPLTRVFPEKYLRRSWRLWSGYWMYQKR